MFKIVTDTNPSIDDIMTVRKGIINFNDRALHYESKSLAIFMKDNNDVIQGGVLAWLDASSIYIEILWINEQLRHQGYGSKLLHAAEDEGKKNNCQFSTLDTFGFQAEDFYVKNGYEKLGEVKNYIRQYSRIFFRKTLK